MTTAKKQLWWRALHISHNFNRRSSGRCSGGISRGGMGKIHSEEGRAGKKKKKVIRSEVRSIPFAECVSPDARWNRVFCGRLSTMNSRGETRDEGGEGPQNDRVGANKQVRLIFTIAARSGEGTRSWYRGTTSVHSLRRGPMEGGGGGVERGKKKTQGRSRIAESMLCKASERCMLFDLLDWGNRGGSRVLGHSRKRPKKNRRLKNNPAHSLIQVGSRDSCWPPIYLRVVF